MRSHMNYSDIPVLQSYGFQISESHASWFKADNEGRVWQVREDDDTGILKWRVVPPDGPTTPEQPMTREDFDTLFTR